MCRICGCTKDNSLSLFPAIGVGDQENESNASIVERINKYLPIEVTQQSPFPKVVCFDCNQEILEMVKFWKKFTEGQEKLYNLLKEEGLDPGTWTLKTPLYKSTIIEELKTKSKRGRPKKGSEKNKMLTPFLETIDLNIEAERGKRKKKVPQKFSDSVHNINTYSDEITRVDPDKVEEDEYGRISLDINTIEGDGGEEFTVSVDVAELDDSNPNGAPLLHDISAMLSQLGQTQGPSIKQSPRKPDKTKISISCDICGKRFKSAAVLARHVMRHGEIKYRCDQADCELLVDSKEQLNHHHQESGHEGVIVVEFKERVHEDLKGDDLEIKAPLLASEKGESDDFIIDGECDENVIKSRTECKVEMDNPEFMLENSKEVNFNTSNQQSSDEIASCPHCVDGLMFSSKSALKTHIDLIHGAAKWLPCIYCKESFPHKPALTSHISSYHKDREGEKAYPCEECDRVFNRPSSLSYHKDAAHTLARFPCSVPDCNKEFKMRNLLTRHMLTHNSERPHQCVECYASFKTPSNLKAHQSKHSGEVKYFCHECGQPFKHKTSLNQHMRWHTGERPFKCDFCGKSFGQNGNLQEHLRIHTGEKPFKCELCPRSFTTSSQHRLHLKRHTGDRPHKCEFCGKTFLHSETYKAHVRRHKGEKPFECKFCHKGFAESWALTKHSRFHTGVQPYKCLVCGKAFSDSSNLSKHKKTHRDYDEDKLKQTVWKIIRDAGSTEVNTAARVDMVDEDTQQVIYVTFQDGAEKEVKVVEADVKDGGLDLSNLSSQTMMVDTSDDHVEAGHDASNQDGHTIDLTTRDGQQIRLVAPLNIDPLAFATEYLKDLQQIQN